MVETGLHFLPRDSRRAAIATAAVVLALVAFIVALDLIAKPPADYVAFFTSPLWPRTPLMCADALLDEVKWRGLLMTALIGGYALLKKPVPAWFIVFAIVISQLANVWPWILADPLYGSLRYWLVGSAWGWLYWRHGWASAAIGHSASHLLLDPLLFVALS